MPSSKPAAQLDAQAQCGVRGRSWTIARVKAAAGSSARRPDPPLVAISVRSPAEPLVRARLAGINVVKVRFTQKADVWAADLLRGSGQRHLAESKLYWIASGAQHTASWGLSLAHMVG